jgi:hypothetical protein
VLRPDRLELIGRAEEQVEQLRIELVPPPAYTLHSSPSTVEEANNLVVPPRSGRCASRPEDVEVPGQERADLATRGEDIGTPPRSDPSLGQRMNSRGMQNLTLAAVRFDRVIGGMWWMQKLTRSGFL